MSKPWVVDTCVILDILLPDPKFGAASARFLEELKGEGIVISPVTMVELAAAFAGDICEQKRFLDQAGIGYADAWTLADSESAHGAWFAHVAAKRAGKEAKRPVADILIGGFAANRRGLITRNAKDFQRRFPDMDVRTPTP